VSIILAGVAAAAVFICLFFALAPTGGSVLSRIDRAYDDQPEVAEEAPQANPFDALRTGLQSTVGKQFDRSERGSRLADALVRADLRLKPVEWVVISLVVGAAVGGLAMLRFGSTIMFLVGLGVGYIGAQFFLRIRQARRAKAFDAQLAPTILSVSGAIKAGYTFAQAIDLVAKNGTPPMSAELQRVTREAQLGVPIVEALGRMVKRNESEDLKLLLTAVQIQQQVGGNLAQILDTIEYTVRERIRIKGEIKTLTGQARASGWILIILPFALGGILAGIAPSYFNPMLKTIPGQVILGIAGFMVLCGYGIIRKIVNVQV
jgi:tight adherence protein B